MNELRAGIIGLGVGERHIAGFEHDPRCRVTALCDISERRLAEVSAAYPGRRLVTDAEDILDDPDIDVVGIASYDDIHFAQVVRAIGNGKHVFVEKPICQHADQLEEIRARLDERPGTRLSSNLILRMCPRFRRVHGMLREGVFGVPYYLEASYNYGRIHKILDGWRGRLDYYSVTQGGGIHVIDLLTWLAGEAVVEVAAFGTRLAMADSATRFDDTVVAVLKFANGAVGRITSNFACVYPHFHELAVYGTEATFQNGLEAGSLFTSRDPGERPVVIDDPYPGVNKGELIRSFVGAILDGTRPEVDADDVFRAMEVCLAIDRAAETGAPVKIAVN